jgi:hypothetical protein
MLLIAVSNRTSASKAKSNKVQRARHAKRAETAVLPAQNIGSIDVIDLPAEKRWVISGLTSHFAHAASKLVSTTLRLPLMPWYELGLRRLHASRRSSDFMAFCRHNVEKTLRPGRGAAGCRRMCEATGATGFHRPFSATAVLADRCHECVRVLLGVTTASAALS